MNVFKVISSTKIRKKDSSKEDDIEKEKILFYRKIIRFTSYDLSSNFQRALKFRME